MLELKLTVSDPAQIAQIMAIVTGGASSATAAATPEVVKEKKAKEKVTEMPAPVVASEAKPDPAPAAAPTASSESPADHRKRLTPKIVAIAQTEEGRAKVKAIWAELGVGKFSEVPDGKLAEVEAKLA